MAQMGNVVSACSAGDRLHALCTNWHADMWSTPRCAHVCRAAGQHLPPAPRRSFVPPQESTADAPQFNIQAQEAIQEAASAAAQDAAKQVAEQTVRAALRSADWDNLSRDGSALVQQAHEDAQGGAYQSAYTAAKAAAVWQAAQHGGSLAAARKSFIERLAQKSAEQEAERASAAAALAENMCLVVHNAFQQDEDEHGIAAYHPGAGQQAPAVQQPFLPPLPRVCCSVLERDSRHHDCSVQRTCGFVNADVLWRQYRQRGVCMSLGQVLAAQQSTHACGKLCDGS